MDKLKKMYTFNAFSSTRNQKWKLLSLGDWLDGLDISIQRCIETERNGENLFYSQNDSFDLKCVRL